MSIVVAFVTDTHLHIGSDTLVSTGEMTWEGDHKVWTSDNFLYGAVGDLSAVSALKALPWPPWDTVMPIDTWMQSIVSPFLKEEDVDGEWELVICTPEKLFSLDNELALSSHMSGYYAIGSGSYFSLGYLYEKKLTANNLFKALEAACHYSPSCGASILVESIKLEGDNV